MATPSTNKNWGILDSIVNSDF